MNNSHPQNTNKSVPINAFFMSLRLFPSILSPLFFLFCSFILVLAFTFLSPFSILITAPLIFAPSCFSLLCSVNAINKGEEASPSLFFKNFFRFFSREVFHSFRFLRNFFLSLFISFGLLFIYSFVYSSIISNIDPSFLEAISKFVKFQEEGNDVAAMNFLLENEALTNFSFWGVILFCFSFSLLFLHFFFRSTMITLIPTSKEVLTYRARISIYRMGLRREEARGYNLKFMLAFLPAYIICIVLFALGVYLSFLIEPLSLKKMNVALVCGLSGFLLGLFLTIPYLDEALIYLAYSYQKPFLDSLTVLKEETIKQYEALVRESDKTKEFANKMLEDLNREKEENHKDTSDSSKDDSDEDK